MSKPSFSVPSKSSNSFESDRRLLWISQTTSSTFCSINAVIFFVINSEPLGGII